MNYPVFILGIDTSCDDTSASLMEFDQQGTGRIISNIVSSQFDIHHKYGGIVPELASRKHIETIWAVVSEALTGYGLNDIGAIAVCAGPGLIGSLLVGCSFAKALCYATGIPLIGVNHLEGHALSGFLTDKMLGFPFLSLVVSGGHTSIYRVDDFGSYVEIGRTRDDAAGEAYDKVSKLLGFGYPGGPEIDKKAKLGRPDAVDFPRAYLPDSMDFSFSGLKTAVKLAIEGAPELRKEDVAASFQASVVDVLERKTRMAIEQSGIRRLCLAGGVAANSALRERMISMCEQMNAELFLPSISLCTDNAAMIALSGFYRLRSGIISGLELNPRAHLPLGS